MVEKICEARINTGERVEKFRPMVVKDSATKRQYIIKCIMSLCKKNNITQSEISKRLKKIDNTEVEKYFYSGHIIITVVVNGVDEFYVYKGEIS